MAQCSRTGQHRAKHAQTLHGLAARARLLDEVRGLCGCLAGFLLEPTGAGLIEQRDREQQASGEHRQHAEHPVKEEQHEQEHRRPGGIEEGECTGTRRKPLDRLQVGQAGCRAGALGRCYRAHQDGAQHTRVEPLLQARADTGQHPPARVVEHPHQQEQERHQGGERDQRRLRARTQHPVVDLQHEQRPGQHEHVHGHAEQAARHKQAPALRQRRPDFPVAIPVFGHRANVLSIQAGMQSTRGIEQQRAPRRASLQYRVAAPCYGLSAAVRTSRRRQGHILSPSVVVEANTKSSASRSATATFSSRTEPAP